MMFHWLEPAVRFVGLVLRMKLFTPRSGPQWFVVESEY